MTRAKKKPAPSAQVPTDSTVRQVVIVSGEGSDDDIRARCAESVPDWEIMSPKVQAEVIRLMRSFWNRPVAASYDVTKTENGVAHIAPRGKYDTLTLLRQVEAFATGSFDFAQARLDDLAGHRRGVTGQALTADLAFILGGGATDTVQSTLLTQMAATHDAAMRALGRSTRAEYVEQAQVFGNLSVKLLNAFSRQAETLGKLQRGGEQVVKHVHIDNRNGGQAIVTETFVKGGVGAEPRNQFHEQGAYGPSMLGHHAAGHGVPLSGDEGQETVPPARGQGDGGTQGE